MDDTHFSLESILRIRGEGFATIRSHSATVAMLASSIETLDLALQTNQNCRSIDVQQSLIDAARRLAALLESGDA